MLRQTFERSFGEPVVDVVWHGERAFVALGAGLVVLERGEVRQRFDVSVESLVPSEDGRSVLGVSPPPPRLGYFPRLKAGLPQVDPRARRVYRLADPWAACLDLGAAPMEGWCGAFDGRYWVTYDGDFVDLHECAGAKLEPRARVETSWPHRIVRVPGGVWVETSSLGAQHFVILSVPGLSELERGDLPRCAIEFPPEMVSHSAQAPTLARPIFAVDAAALPVTIEGGRDQHHPIKNVHRVVTSDGRTVATLPARSAGLAASNERALVWCETGAGLEFALVSLRAGRLESRFTLAGAAGGGGKLFGRDVVAWAGDTVRVFRDVGGA
ncbi:MAG TPA: hypothetical protein VFS00_30045 [Polyangiaceae bacterium]|nr:hypothetical protein [Polyangiaceae bacterium]